MEVSLRVLSLSSLQAERGNLYCPPTEIASALLCLAMTRVTVIGISGFGILWDLVLRIWDFTAAMAPVD